MKSDIKLLRILVLFLLILLIIPNNLAYGDEGTGEGGGKGNPLALVESTPANGAKNVKTDVEILMLFNKNVVNMTVKENNLQCIKLLDKDNKEVAIELIFADDQINPEKKREIRVKPVQALEKNNTYKIKILPALMAKNGTNLGKTVEVALHTEASQENISKTTPAVPATTVNTPLPKSEPLKKEEKPAEISPNILEEDILAAQTEPAETELETEVLATQSAEIQPLEKQLEEAKENNSSNYYPTIFALIIAVLIVSLGVIKMRKKK